MKCCHSKENKDWHYKSHLDCWSVACGWFWLSLQTLSRCCHFAASYIFSLITCFAWTGGSGTIVPPYLRGQLGGTSSHRRILIQAVNTTHCWLLSHMGLYLGCYCVCSMKKRESLNLSWKQCWFPFGTGSGDFTTHPWLTNDESQCRSVRQFLN